MRLILNEFGSCLSKKENRFVVRCKNERDEYSADIVEQIVISSPSSITQNAIRLAIEKNIDIVLTSYSGKPFARIYPCNSGGTTLTRREQARAYLNDKGFEIAKKLIEAKLKNQLFLIKRLNKTRNGIFNDRIESLKGNIFKLKEIYSKNIDECREKILGYEGYAASIYFDCLSKIVPLKNRDPKGSDIFNVCLNYGYGILYSEVERACILSGLDPYLGFLHTDRYGKPSMVLDLVEQFRPLIDRAIINLFVRKQISDDYIQKIGEANLLTEKGRSKIIEEIMKTLSFKLKNNGKKQTISEIILDQAREIAKFLLGNSNDYKPFIWC